MLVRAIYDLNFEAYIPKRGGRLTAPLAQVGDVVLIAPDLDPDVAIAKLFKALSDPDLPWGGAPIRKILS